MSSGRHADTPTRSGINKESLISNKPSATLLPFSDNVYYRCRHCNYLTPKNGAIISGYDSEHSLRHIHCSNCGRIVIWSPGGSKIRSIAVGAFFTVIGGALAFLLYPSLNIYGLQVGFAASLYGVLKAVFL